MNSGEILGNQEPFEIRLASGYVSKRLEKREGLTPDEQARSLREELTDVENSLLEIQQSGSSVRIEPFLAEARGSWLHEQGVDTRGKLPPEPVDREIFGQALASTLRLAVRDPEAFMLFWQSDRDH